MEDSRYRLRYDFISVEPRDNTRFLRVTRVWSNETANIYKNTIKGKRSMLLFWGVWFWGNFTKDERNILIRGKQHFPSSNWTDRNNWYLEGKRFPRIGAVLSLNDYKSQKSNSTRPTRRYVKFFSAWLDRFPSERNAKSQHWNGGFIFDKGHARNPATMAPS